MREWIQFIREIVDTLKGVVQHFGKYADLLSCRESDKKIDTTVILMENMKLQYSQQAVSLAQKLEVGGNG